MPKKSGIESIEEVYMDWNSDLEVVRFATEGKADLLARQIPNASLTSSPA